MKWLVKLCSLTIAGIFVSFTDKDDCLQINHLYPMDEK